MIEMSGGLPSSFSLWNSSVHVESTDRRTALASSVDNPVHVVVRALTASAIKVIPRIPGNLIDESQLGFKAKTSFAGGGGTVWVANRRNSLTNVRKNSIMRRWKMVVSALLADQEA